MELCLKKQIMKKKEMDLLATTCPSFEVWKIANTHFKDVLGHSEKQEVTSITHMPSW